MVRWGYVFFGDKKNLKCRCFHTINIPEASCLGPSTEITLLCQLLSQPFCFSEEWWWDFFDMSLGDA